MKGEGYLMIDHRAVGIPGWRGMVEKKTYTCNHCHAIVFVNPERARERGYCRGCDSTLCDNCAAIRAKTLECRPMSKIIDETLSMAEKRASAGNPTILLPKE